MKKKWLESTGFAKTMISGSNLLRESSMGYARIILS